MEQINQKYTMKERIKYAKEAYRKINRKRSPMSLAAVAREFGVNHGTLRSWIVKYIENPA